MNLLLSVFTSHRAEELPELAAFSSDTVIKAVCLSVCTLWDTEELKSFRPPVDETEPSWCRAVQPRKRSPSTSQFDHLFMTLGTPFFFLCRSRYDSTVICSPGYLFYTNLWQDPYNMWCIGFGVRSQTPVGWSREYWRRGSATSKTLKNIPVILEIHTSVRRSSNYFVSSNDFTSTCMQLTGDWHRHCNAAGLSALRGCVLFT